MKRSYFLCSSFLGLAFLLIQSCSQKPLCDLPQEITYSQTVAPLIEAKCFMCHSQEVYKTKASRNKIYTYESLKKMAVSGTLMGAITHQKGYIAMPYKKNEKIDTCAIATIAKWVATGMKQ